MYYLVRQSCHPCMYIIYLQVDTFYLLTSNNSTYFYTLLTKGEGGRERLFQWKSLLPTWLWSRPWPNIQGVPTLSDLEFGKATNNILFRFDAMVYFLCLLTLFY
uniref:Uncharacterized protein n=1 Tax=Cacopsylla melanoneura TaxID=428564 RepID=A0A8D8ZEG8_9HEMI